MSDEDGRKTEASGSWATQLITSYDFPLMKTKIDWYYCTEKMNRIAVVHIQTKILQAYSCTNCYLKKLIIDLFKESRKMAQIQWDYMKLFICAIREKTRVLQLWLTISHQWCYD